MSIAENHNRAQYGYYVVDLPVEFLPGMHVTTRASIEISDEDIARKSLDYIREKHPDARLSGHVWLDPDDNPVSWKERIEQRTDAIREQLEVSA